jgi:hypothetical protein
MGSAAGGESSVVTAEPGFQRIRNRTHCVYARSSRIWFPPKWQRAATLEEYVDLAVPSMLRFLDIGRQRQLDGWVLEVPDAFGRTLDELARSTSRILTRLCRHDADARLSMLRDPGRREWQFVMRGTHLYVLAFASCYPRDSSRYAFDVGSTMLLFQPEHAFDRRIPEGEERIPTEVRERIRRDFAAHGRPYDLRITLASREAWRYVKPLRLGDPPVEWWEKEAPHE